jgi:hypothetical protein
MSKSTVKVVEIDTNPAVKSLKDLRKELMEYKNQMANLEEGSDAFLEVANKAGEAKHQIDEINESIKGASADFGDMVGNVTNVSAGITGAFQAVAGGLQAMGVESEAIDKTIAKMQGLMAVTDGLSKIDNAIKSLDKLRNSITSTTGAAKLLKAALEPKVFLPITAAIAGITLVFQRWKKQEDEVQEAIKKRREELEKIKMDKIIDDHKRYNDELQRTLTIQEGYNQGFYKGDRKGELIANINAYQQEVNRLMMTVPEGMQKKIDEYNEAISRYTEADQEYWELLVEITHYEGEIENFNRKSETERNVLTATYEEYAKKLESLKTQLNVLNAIERGEADLIAQRQQAFGDIELKGVVAPLQLEPLPKESVEELGEKIGKMLADSEIKARNKKWKEKVENGEVFGNEIFENLKSSIEIFSESSLGITDGWIESLNVFQTAFQQTMKIVKDEGDITWDSYSNVAITALSGIGSILKTLSNEQDASNEDGFEQMKKFQIASTVMNMLSGIMSAWTSAMSPNNAWMSPWGQVAYGTAMSGMIAGIGAAQIEKIKSQTMQSANPNTNINAKTVNSMVVPPVQYSNAVQGAQTEGAITNQRVYVLSSDITDVGNSIKTQVVENIY